jgi:hypothetical protein
VHITIFGTGKGAFSLLKEVGFHADSEETEEKNLKDEANICRHNE